MTSGKLVVGAAIIAPVGSNVRSFNANADLCTWSRQRPWYVQPESQLCQDRKSTRLNSSHSQISYAVFCLKKKKKTQNIIYAKKKKKNNKNMNTKHSKL